MALLRVPEHRPGDLAAWERWQARDAAWARTESFRQRCRVALARVVEFAQTRQYVYASTSWGKDSTVLAHLVWTGAEELGVQIPLVHVDVWPINNPHCALVRDEFFARWPGLIYDEIRVYCERDERYPADDYVDGWRASGTLEAGTREAERRWGRCYLSGVRSEESSARRRREESWGAMSPRTCAPITDWSAEDVYAYLWAHDLPVHPAYAMVMGGSLDRRRLRVSFLGLRHGLGMGRREWERTYYPRLRFGEGR